MKSNNVNSYDDVSRKSEHLGRSVGLVMLLSTLARGLSLIGSMRYTAWFGYTLETDIYSYAVNLPNIIFTCIGTALVTVVIPIFAGRLAAGEKDRAYGFIDNVITIALIIAACIAAAGILISPLIVRMINKFNTGDPSLALFALRLMFPVMLFHAVNYILQGVLQTNSRFMLPAIVSAFSGLSVIIYVSLFAGRFGMRGLLVATFIGLASQALVLIPPVAKSLKYRYKPSLHLTDGDVRHAGKLAIPVLVSSSAYQFNMFMNSTFAAAFDGGVLTITNMLTLAFTASQLFIISTLSVYFPRMSARYAVGDDGGFRSAFNSVMRLIIVFAVPASAALAYLSRFVVPLLYGHGNVTESDMVASVAVFSIYAGAIAAIGFKEAADRAFYAIRDTRTPAIVSIIIMSLNIALSFMLMRKIGLVGLPIAYFAAIAAGAVILLLILRKKISSQISNQMSNQKDLVSLAIKCVVSTCAMLITLIIVELAINAIWGIPGQAQGQVQVQAHGSIINFQNVFSALSVSKYNMPIFSQVLRVVALTITGGSAYAAMSCLLGVREMRSILRLRRKLTKGDCGSSPQ